MATWNKIQTLGVLSSLLLITACGGNPLGVRFDASVPGDQRSFVESDLNRLASLQLGTATSSDLSALGMSDLSATSLTQWLQSRMAYIVGEGFDYETNSTRYPVSGGLRFTSYTGYGQETLFSALGQASNTQTVMMNLGAYLYLDGKEKQSEYVLRLSNGKTVSVFSPRVNIVQIGEGLFEANAIPGVALGAKSNSLLRTSTYFHEGRHSDGNGTNAGFPHASCPSGDYADLYACENNSNGPYAIQTVFLRYAIPTCTDCSYTEQAGLEISMADYASRQIQRLFPSATPEALSNSAYGSAR